MTDKTRWVVVEESGREGSRRRDGGIKNKRKQRSEIDGAGEKVSW